MKQDKVSVSVGNEKGRINRQTMQPSNRPATGRQRSNRTAPMQPQGCLDVYKRMNEGWQLKI